MSKITATIITYNEAEHIAACLESLKGVADEIIVVDSFSTDSTVEICRAYGCKITRRRMSGYGAQRQYATSMATHAYVLSIDGDEELSPALARSLKALKEEGFSHRVYCFSRLNFFCGKPIRHCGWYPDVHVRLFDKRYAAWNLRDVSEGVNFPDSVRPCLLEGDILHYRCTTPEEYHRTERRHASIRARVLAASSERLHVLSPTLAAMRAFTSSFINHGGIFEGAEGRAISHASRQWTFYAYAMARRLRRRASKKALRDGKQ